MKLPSYGNELTPMGRIKEVVIEAAENLSRESNTNLDACLVYLSSSELPIERLLKYNEYFRKKEIENVQ